MTKVPEKIKNFPKKRMWTYPPDAWWFGWKTLVPVSLGHDEFSRRTLVLGWTVTGLVVIALGYCGDEECYADTERSIEEGWYDDEG